MKAIVVDDEKLLLDGFRYECGDVSGLEILGYFSAPLKALAFAKENPLDVAFVDLRMPMMDGLTFAAELRALYPRIKVIAVTSCDSDHDKDVLDRMDGIVLKPYERADVEKVMADISGEEETKS